MAGHEREPGVGGGLMSVHPRGVSAVARTTKSDTAKRTPSARAMSRLPPRLRPDATTTHPAAREPATAHGRGGRSKAPLPVKNSSTLIESCLGSAPHSSQPMHRFSRHLAPPSLCPSGEIGAQSLRAEAGYTSSRKPPGGFDPPTCSLRNCRSAGLSYGGIAPPPSYRAVGGNFPLQPAGTRRCERADGIDRRRASELE